MIIIKNNNKKMWLVRSVKGDTLTKLSKVINQEYLLQDRY